jgi:hypothetical protein
MKKYYVANANFKGLPKDTPFEWNEEQQLYIGQADYIKEKENSSSSTHVQVGYGKETMEDLRNRGYLYVKLTKTDNDDLRNANAIAQAENDKLAVAKAQAQSHQAAVNAIRKAVADFHNIHSYELEEFGANTAFNKPLGDAINTFFDNITRRFKQRIVDLITADKLPYDINLGNVVTSVRNILDDVVKKSFAIVEGREVFVGSKDAKTKDFINAGILFLTHSMTLKFADEFISLLSFYVNVGLGKNKVGDVNDGVNCETRQAA